MHFIPGTLQPNFWDILITNEELDELDRMMPAEQGKALQCIL
jgi:hypothetical protein